MRSRRGSWLGSSLVTAAFLLIPAATTVQAQPGYGADPFWPYNAQYAPYATAVGPASPVGGQGAAVLPRNGLRSANQFQSYMDSLGGEGRNTSDRANVGMPYYRSAVDPGYDPRGRGERQYRPNARANRTFEDTQRKVADTYFRYYSESDPARRAELLKEYRQARHDEALNLSDRWQTPSRVLESSDGMDAEPRRSVRSGTRASRTDASDRMGASARERAAAPTGRFGPAPEVPLTRPRGSSSGTTQRRTTPSRPSDILNRSRAMDLDEGVPTRRLSPGSAARSRARTAPTSPATGSDGNP
jgi:hypothetical protein